MPAAEEQHDELGPEDVFDQLDPTTLANLKAAALEVFKTVRRTTRGAAAGIWALWPYRMVCTDCPGERGKPGAAACL